MSQNILRLITNPQLLKFLTQIEEIQNPEFQTSTFTFKGKTWIGILIREKDVEKEKKDETR